MANNARRQRIMAITRRVYHALPLTPLVKLKLRRLLAPYLHATVEMAEGVGVIKALSGIRDSRSQNEWGGEQEIAFQRALISIGKQAALYGPVSHFIILPFLATGGAERVAINFATAIRAARPKNSILLIVADRNVVDASIEMPDGIILLVLDSVFDAYPSYEKKQWLLEHLVRAILPETLHNINSEVAWQLILSKGKHLSALTRLYASIFAFQFAPDGKTKIGYAAYFLKPGLPHLTGLLSDNQRFVYDAATEYSLSPDEQSKLHVVYNPVRVSGTALVPSIDARIGELGSRLPHRRLRVLWAGRLDAEKRIDLLVELIKQADFVDFDVYGQAVVDSESVLPSRPNVDYKGPFVSPLELIKDRTYDAFVFTSRWEGMPNILLEVGMLGIPVIAPTVGGVGELVSEYSGFPLPERPNVSDYLVALEHVRKQPKDAADRARTLKHVIERRHSWIAFMSSVDAIPGYLANQQGVSCKENV